MNSVTTPLPSPLVLNRFPIKKLSTADCTVWEYQCTFNTPPEPGDEQRAISAVCYKLGTIAVRLGCHIITKEPLASATMRGDTWNLTESTPQKILQCTTPPERRALESFERKFLDQQMKCYQNRRVEWADEGGLIWWRTDEQGIEKSGEGWEVHRGRRIDVHIDSSGTLYLDIDIHFRFYTSWTLHQWLETYPDSPITYVRNTYPNKKK